MAKMLLASFPNQQEADRALHELEQQGYTRENISIISKDNKYEQAGYDTGSDVAKGAGSGAATCGVIGGLAGLLAGVGVFPAIAGLFIGGPIVAALGLAGAAATTASGALTGAAAGGLIGALTNLGLSKESASEYDETVKGGGVVLGISGHGDDLSPARQLLEQCGAQNFDSVELKDDRRSETQAEESASADHAPLRPEPSFGERRVEDRRDDYEDVL
jgi:uncharacterized membrane protein